MLTAALAAAAAAVVCCWQVCKALIAAGADVDLPDKASAMTAVHYAAMGGHLEILEHLIGGASARAGSVAEAFGPHWAACCSLFSVRQTT